MRRRVRLGHVVVALAVIAAVAIAAPAIGGPSLKKLVKKEVAKQLKGKQGPQGPQGLQGSPGANATALFAAVNSDATVSAQSGVTGAVTHTATSGQYTIPFNRDIDACAPLATLTNDDPGQVMAFVLGGANNNVTVVTQDNNGAAADGAFSVAIFC